MLLELMSRHAPLPLATDDSLVKKRRIQKRDKVRWEFCKALTQRVRHDLIAGMEEDTRVLAMGVVSMRERNALLLGLEPELQFLCYEVDDPERAALLGNNRPPPPPSHPGRDQPGFPVKSPNFRCREEGLGLAVVLSTGGL